MVKIYGTKVFRNAKLATVHGGNVSSFQYLNVSWIEWWMDTERKDRAFEKRHKFTVHALFFHCLKEYESAFNYFKQGKKYIRIWEGPGNKINNQENKAHPSSAGSSHQSVGMPRKALGESLFSLQGLPWASPAVPWGPCVRQAVPRGQKLVYPTGFPSWFQTRSTRTANWFKGRQEVMWRGSADVRGRKNSQRKFWSFPQLLRYHIPL